MKTNRFLQATYLGVFLILFCSFGAYAQDVNLGTRIFTQVKSQGDTLNFEIGGRKNWDYDLKRVKEQGKTKILLAVKGLSSDDIKKIKNVNNNPFVSQIKASSSPVDGQYQIEFVLKSDQVEAFDYLTDAPSKLIVDFYFNGEPVALSPEENTQKTSKAKKSKTVAKNSVMSNKSRAPANNDYYNLQDFSGNGDQNPPLNLQANLFDESNEKLSRFRLTSQELKSAPTLKPLFDYYLWFPVVDQGFSFWNKMKINLPGYEIQPKKTEENKQARLIKTLFDKNRPLVLKQTTDWFEKKYPESEYLEAAYGMTGDAFFKKWNESKSNEDLDIAQEYYKKLIEKFPTSALAERTSLARGFLDLDRKDYLNALRKFKIHSENQQYKNNLSQLYAQAGEADALAKLSKYNDAIKILNEIETKSTDSALKAEISFKVADYLMMDGRYADAKKQYNDTITKYPALAKNFPSAIFNKMESSFRLKNHIEAYQSALDFVDQYPRHEFAPYALTRLGEVLEIMSSAPEKAVGAYLETQFRYGESPKTIVARLHLLSLRMKGMKEIELKKTLEKMNELAAKSELENIQQFKAAMIADGFSRREEYGKAIDALAKFYQENPHVKNTEQVVNRIKRSIYDSIRVQSEKGNHKSVLELTKKYADSWIRNDRRIDNTYYVGKAYQAAGAFQPALKEFTTVLDRLSGLQTNANAQVIQSSENLPKQEQVYLSIAQVQNQLNDSAAALQSIEKIKQPELLTQAEQISRVDVASQLYEKKGDFKSAVRYLHEVVRTWGDSPDLVMDSAVRLAHLQAKLNEPDKAISLLQKLSEKPMERSSEIKLNKAISEIALSANKAEPAIEALAYLIEDNSKSQEQKNLAEEKFKLGDLYFKQGDLKNARNAWTSFNDSDDQFWKKLAADKLNGHEWQGEYKKYLKRIPAAVKGLQ